MSWRDWRQFTVRCPHSPGTSRKRRVLLAGALTGLVAIGAVAYIATDRRPATLEESQGATVSKETSRTGPPWIYGRANARFTIVEYADLECPYCRDYFVILQNWVDENTDVNWQWHHLPLAGHEPAASHSAKLAECVGEVLGNTAFWKTLAWAYEHTRGAGGGVPEALRPPFTSPLIETCLQGPRPEAVIRAQADEAARANIRATPTIRLIDRKTGHFLTLQGVLDADALLSAVDLLVSESAAPAR